MFFVPSRGAQGEREARSRNNRNPNRPAAYQPVGSGLALDDASLADARIAMDLAQSVVMARVVFEPSNDLNRIVPKED